MSSRSRRKHQIRIVARKDEAGAATILRRRGATGDRENTRPDKQQEFAGRKTDGTDDNTQDRGGSRLDARRVKRIARMILKVLLPALVIAGAYAGYSYLRATAPEARKRANVERIFSVTTVTAQRGDHKPTLKLYGTTTTGRRVDIRSLVAGKVITTGDALREGGEVAKGAMLLTIDPFDYNSAKLEAEAQLAEARGKLMEQKASMASDKASLKFARQQVGLAKKDLDRAVPLARRGTVSSRTVDDRRNIVSQRQQAAELLKNNILVWEARIAQQHAAIDRLKSSVKRAGRRLEETKLTAPFNAYVTGVGAQVGRMVSANDKVATLIDRDWIEVRLTLTDSQFGRIMAAEKSTKGRKVEVLWNVGPEPLVYGAVIDRVEAEIASGSGGVGVYARITNPLKPVPLRPGAFVEVRVPDTTFTKAYRLPHTALYDGDTVYAVINGRLAARKVRKVGTAGDDILLTGAIEPGDRIIATRLSTPGEGLRVKER